MYHIIYIWNDPRVHTNVRRYEQIEEEDRDNECILSMKCEEMYSQIGIGYACCVLLD